MNSWVLASALLLLAAPAAAFAAAGEATLVRTYETGTLNLRTEARDPLGVTPDGSVDVGGVRIPARQFALGWGVADIVFQDQAGTPVRGLVCQDLDGDYVCGESRDGEPRIEFCDRLSDPAKLLSRSGVALRGGADLVIFVFATPLRVSVANPHTTGPAPCPDGSPGLATTGTITVTLAS